MKIIFRAFLSLFAILLSLFVCIEFPTRKTNRFIQHAVRETFKPYSISFSRFKVTPVWAKFENFSLFSGKVRLFYAKKLEVFFIPLPWRPQVLLARVSNAVVSYLPKTGRKKGGIKVARVEGRNILISGIKIERVLWDLSTNKGIIVVKSIKGVPGLSYLKIRKGKLCTGKFILAEKPFSFKGRVKLAMPLILQNVRLVPEWMKDSYVRVWGKVGKTVVNLDFKGVLSAAGLLKDMQGSFSVEGRLYGTPRYLNMNVYVFPNDVGVGNWRLEKSKFLVKLRGDTLSVESLAIVSPEAEVLISPVSLSLSKKTGFFSSVVRYLKYSVNNISGRFKIDKSTLFVDGDVVDWGGRYVYSINYSFKNKKGSVKVSSKKVSVADLATKLRLLKVKMSGIGKLEASGTFFPLELKFNFVVNRGEFSNLPIQAKLGPFLKNFKVDPIIFDRASLEGVYAKGLDIRAFILNGWDIKGVARGWVGSDSLFLNTVLAFSPRTYRKVANVVYPAVAHFVDPHGWWVFKIHFEGSLKDPSVSFLNQGTDDLLRLLPPTTD